MSGDVAYLDTSAFLKLVMPEPESAALRAHLQGWPIRVSAALLRTEALRAASRATPTRIAAVRDQLRKVTLIDLEHTLLAQAGTIQPAVMRSLDAVHVATALSLGDDLGELVTYDARMTSAALAHGIAVSSPV